MTTLSSEAQAFTYDATGLPESLLLRLYREMLYARLIEEKMLSLLRQAR